VNPTAFGILALRAAGASAGSARSAAWLRANQNDDGGWGFASGAASDPDSTGAVLQALAASGKRAGIRPGVRYLRNAQRSGGGFALASGAVNSQSTAWAVQGLIAARVSPSSVRTGGGSPLSYLAATQARDGHYRYSQSSDQTPVWVTGQALAAVSGKAFPLAPVPRSLATAKLKGEAGSEKPSPGSAPGTAKGHAKKAGGKQAATQPTHSEPAATDTAPVPLAPASATPDDDGGGIPGWLIAALAVLAVAAAVWGGWLVYRRRLPSGTRPG
jgi:hypothetical protein